MKAATVSVPASTANLGPGFDAFALALDLHNTFTAEYADDWVVEVVGEGAGVLSTGADNAVARAMARVFSEIDDTPRAARIMCDNAIPTGRGLGSSSAAVVGGLMLGNALLGGAVDDARIYELAVEIEGHPDNVAAALRGGLTVSYREDGCWRCAALQPAGGLAAVLAVPVQELSTSVSRAMLPDMVPYADAAFNAGRTGVLMAALMLGRADLLAAGLVDKLHEPYRCTAIPDYTAVRAGLLEAGAQGVALSGAGPTIVGLIAAEDDHLALSLAHATARRAQEAFDVAGLHRTAWPVAIARRGAHIADTGRPFLQADE